MSTVTLNGLEIGSITEIRAAVRDLAMSRAAFLQSPVRLSATATFIDADVDYLMGFPREQDIRIEIDPLSEPEVLRDPDPDEPVAQFKLELLSEPRIIERSGRKVWEFRARLVQEP
jgi:hypothetical protein